MSRPKRGWNWRPPKKSTSMYLNPDVDDINLALEKEVGMPIMLPEIIKGVKGFNQGSQTGGYQGSNYSSSNWQQGTTYTSCTHKGDAIIYEWEGKKLFGANGRGIDEYDPKWGLIIDLANQVRYPSAWDSFIRTDTTKKMLILKKYLPKAKAISAEILSLNWPDMGVPPVGLDFWDHLWTLLPENTVMCCVGGHGRTGTALAAFMIAAGESYYDASQVVWKKHCDKAIESISQGLYLHKLYLEVLNRERLEAIERNEDLTSIDTELAYAQSHVPHSKDLLGGPVKEDKKVQTGYQGPSHGNQVRTKHLPMANAQELKEGFRLHAGVYYVHECIRGCKPVSGCNIIDHEGWVEMDIEEMANH